MLSDLVVVLYVAATAALLLYGLNSYVMLVLYGRRRREAEESLGRMKERFGNPLERSDLPFVTTQIPVYNEFNVVERCMRAAAAMRYAPGRHEVQVLDDSTDETKELIDRVAAELRAGGSIISVIRRDNRSGFKAGALANGMDSARGSLVAVFDADFIPPADYLLSMVPFFMEDDRLGFAQARWGHVNEKHSMLTRVQSIGIDGHFLIEQTARCWGNLFMNFNGTAGIWRRTAIESGGGWQADTLTEDLDLSYRVQLKGWGTLYLPQVLVPAELPEDINALRGQQFRWAKGSFQTLIKIFPALMQSDNSAFRKVQAVLHMSGYFVHPLMLTVSVLALPFLFASTVMKVNVVAAALVAIPLALSIFGPSTLYIVGQKAEYKDWVRRAMMMPFLIIVGVGLAFSNTRAIIEAIVRHRSDFVRTPKRGERTVKLYRLRLPWTAFIEIALGLYTLVTLKYYVDAGKYMVGPFLALYAAGFLFVGVLTILHFLRQHLHADPPAPLQPG